MFRDNLPLVLTAWIALIALLVVARRRRHMAGVGLVLTYVLTLWMNYWIASALYVLPWYTNAQEQSTVAGTEQSLYGVAAFVFGSLVLSPFLVDSGILPRASGIFDFDPRLPKMFLAAGAFFYVALSTPLGRLPSVTAIISAGQQLLVAGVCLCWWQAWKSGERKLQIVWAAAASLPPFFTLITRGFMGYGVFASLSIVLFLFSFAKSRLKYLVVGLLLLYPSLSVYETYMRDRSFIRKAVWGGQELGGRVDAISASAAQFTWFDPTETLQLDRINDRMNQSYLAGMAVMRLEETGDFANGSTLIDAVLAVIPRALWTTKTIAAGSGDLVTRYTGFKFDTSSTSVGIGPVMELYINFGTTGVVFGFLLLGVLVTSLDILATERLLNSDLPGFVVYFVCGIAFLQTTGQFVEVTAGVAGSIIVTFLVNKYLQKYQLRASTSAVILTGGTEVAVPNDLRQLRDAPSPV